MRRLSLLFFLGVTGVYVAFSPLAASNMGYVQEEMTACRQILTRLHAGPHSPIEWSRNGVVGLAFQCPFVAVSRVFPGRTETWEERWLAVQPVLMTAGLVTLLFVWCSRLASSLPWGFALALAAGSATMIWPYAYIGLETTQSFFLFLAGFLALQPESSPTWRRALAFGASSGIALAAKSGSFLLAPAVAFLFWRLFVRARDERASKTAAGGVRALATVALAVAVAIIAVNNHFRSLSWVRFGGMRDFAKGWLVHDPLAPVLNFVALFGSPNKGLIVYAPLALLGLAVLPAAFARNRPVALFALLALAGLAGSLSFLEMWSDEMWGPRYLHSAVAPLVLCFAASRRGRPLRARSELPFAAAALCGFVVSALGVLFYYGSMVGVANASAPPTLEAIQGSPTWNHVRFQERLLEVWMKKARGRASAPEYLRHERPWDFTDPTRAPPWNDVDLRPFAEPQSVLIRELAAPTAENRKIRIALGLSLIAGSILLVLVGRASRRLSAES